MKRHFALLLFFFLCGFGYGQNVYIVYFKDKNASEKKAIQVTPRAEARRQKNNVSSDERDFPVSAEYVQKLNEHGKVILSSRWLNAVRFESNLSENDLLEKFSFIASVRKFNFSKQEKPLRDKFSGEINEKTLNYGPADTQVRQIGVDCLHDAGYKGEGVLLAVIDAGFQGMDTISYFDSIYLESRVVDTYDFLGGGSVYNYSLHGTAVSSCIVAEKSGANAYIGTAPDVDLALYVTEDVSSETQLEEFNLVAALERCDSIGVDVVNISLGYVDFDDTTTNYTYADMDGNTTISAIGVKVAASKGIIVVSSAGNNGPSTISTPCDADSMLCAAAVDFAGNYAWFSSVGPAADGRVKPDVAARGGGPWVIMSDGSLQQSNGTSFASPLLAGAAACWVQANPTQTAQEVIQGIRASANQYTTPDQFIGYGIPDFCQAIAGVTETSTESVFKIFPVPAGAFFDIEVLSNSGDQTLQILDSSGKTICEYSITGQGQQRINHSLNSGIYFLRIEGYSSVQKLLIYH